jgi:hypothetical protein
VSLSRLAQQLQMGVYGTMVNKDWQGKPKMLGEKTNAVQFPVHLMPTWTTL